MIAEHCGRCGYLSQYHDIAKRCPGLKTGKWQDRDPIDGALWPEIMARDVAARTRAIEEARRPYIPVTMPEPIVAARPPRSPGEFAGYQGKQAVGLGAKAVSCGFEVAPYYWRAGDGSEGCAVKGFRNGTFAFVATWKRPSGLLGGKGGWTTDVAYAWNPSDRTRAPSKILHTELLDLIA